MTEEDAIQSKRDTSEVETVRVPAAKPPPQPSPEAMALLESPVVVPDEPHPLDPLDKAADRLEQRLNELFDIVGMQGEQLKAQGKRLTELEMRHATSELKVDECRTSTGVARSSRLRLRGRRHG